jgi:hypothetical protein
MVYSHYGVVMNAQIGFFHIRIKDFALGIQAFSARISAEQNMRWRRNLDEKK